MFFIICTTFNSLIFITIIIWIQYYHRITILFCPVYLWHHWTKFKTFINAYCSRPESSSHSSSSLYKHQCSLTFVLFRILSIDAIELRWHENIGFGPLSAKSVPWSVEFLLRDPYFLETKLWFHLILTVADDKLDDGVILASILDAVKFLRAIFCAAQHTKVWILITI